MRAIEILADNAEVLLLRAGHTLFREGEHGDLMFVLVTGTADILIGDRVIESAGPGAFLGELALIDAGPRAATVIAATDCRLLPLDAERFYALVKETPRFAIEVMKVMADRLRRMDHRVATARG